MNNETSFRESDDYKNVSSLERDYDIVEWNLKRHNDALDESVSKFYRDPDLIDLKIKTRYVTSLLNESPKKQEMEALLSEIKALKYKSAMRRSDENRKTCEEIVHLYEENCKKSFIIQALHGNLVKKRIENVSLKEENERHKSERKRLYTLLKATQVSQKDYLYGNSYLKKINNLERQNIELLKKYRDVLNVLKMERGNYAKFLKFVFLKILIFKCLALSRNQILSTDNSVKMKNNNKSDELIIDAKNCFLVRVCKNPFNKINGQSATLGTLNEMTRDSFEADFFNVDADRSSDCYPCSNLQRILVLIRLYKEKFHNEDDKKLHSNVQIESSYVLNRVIHNNIGPNSYPLVLKPRCKNGIFPKKRKRASLSNPQIIRIVDWKNTEKNANSELDKKSKLEAVVEIQSLSRESKSGKKRLSILSSFKFQDFQIFNNLATVNSFEFISRRKTFFEDKIYFDPAGSERTEPVENCVDYFSLLSKDDILEIEYVSNKNQSLEQVNFYDVGEILKISEPALNLALLYTMKENCENSEKFIFNKENENYVKNWLVSSKEEMLIEQVDFKVEKDNLKIEEFDSRIHKQDFNIIEKQDPTVKELDSKIKDQDLQIKDQNSEIKVENLQVAKQNLENEELDFIIEKQQDFKTMNKRILQIKVHDFKLNGQDVTVIAEQGMKIEKKTPQTEIHVAPKILQNSMQDIKVKGQMEKKSSTNLKLKRTSGSIYIDPATKKTKENTNEQDAKTEIVFAYKITQDSRKKIKIHKLEQKKSAQKKVSQSSSKCLNKKGSNSLYKKKPKKKIKSEIKAGPILVSAGVDEGSVLSEIKTPNSRVNAASGVIREEFVLKGVVNEKRKMMSNKILQCINNKEKRLSSKSISIASVAANVGTSGVSSKKIVSESKNPDITCWISKPTSKLLRQSYGEKDEKQFSNKGKSKEFKKEENRVRDCVGGSSRKSSLKGEQFIQGIQPSRSKSSKRINCSRKCSRK